MGKLLLIIGALALMGTDGSGGAHPAGARVGDIPPRYLAEYRRAAHTCPKLDWALLSAIGKVETDHGRARLPGVRSGTNHAGAAGPMQFLAPTFADVRARHPEVGADVYHPRHAIGAAAHYLCDSGLRDGNSYRAIFAYNRADWYVAKVRAQAARYRTAGGER